MEFTYLHVLPIMFFIIIISLNELSIKQYGCDDEVTEMFEKLSALFIVVYYYTVDIKYGIAVTMLLLIYYIGFVDKPREPFEINDAIDRLVGGNKIPKRIIQVWKTWTKSTPEMFREYRKTIKKHMPDYEYMFFKDEQIDDFFKKYYPKYYDTYLRLPLNIQKMDYFRYLAVYHYGGIYLDMDVNVLKPFDEILDNGCVFPIDEIIYDNECDSDRYKHFCSGSINFLLGQYAFAAEPKNKFVKLLVDTINNNIDIYISSYVANSDSYVFETTGPDTVTKLYMNYPDKDNIKILYYNKRQCFGKFAIHDYAGTWKT
jgi:hypothetical protein